MDFSRKSVLVFRVPGGESAAMRQKSTLSTLMDMVPGKKRFGMYRFLPFFFVLGGAMEWFMINIRIGKETFYDVYRRRQSERRFFKVATFCFDDCFAHSWHSLDELQEVVTGNGFHFTDEVLAGRSCHVGLGQMEKTEKVNDSIRKDVSTSLTHTDACVMHPYL
ncbi:unnamed protein product [Ranitomeya imitator]|uniref:Small integral membrane protein 4 n=1 Tax=Ranitomeya imitator TaxID=111125 RepID=A0ABN9L2E6_9NEOB|nr:unnamed protein product [Ranitomeya imitator]